MNAAPKSCGRTISAAVRPNSAARVCPSERRAPIFRVAGSSRNSPRGPRSVSCRRPTTISTPAIRKASRAAASTPAGSAPTPRQPHRAHQPMRKSPPSSASHPKRSTATRSATRAISAYSTSLPQPSMRTTPTYRFRVPSRAKWAACPASAAWCRMPARRRSRGSNWKPARVLAAASALPVRWAISMRNTTNTSPISATPRPMSPHSASSRTRQR